MGGGGRGVALDRATPSTLPFTATQRSNLTPSYPSAPPAHPSPSLAHHHHPIPYLVTHSGITSSSTHCTSLNRLLIRSHISLFTIYSEFIYAFSLTPPSSSSSITSRPHPVANSGVISLVFLYSWLYDHSLLHFTG